MNFKVGDVIRLTEEGKNHINSFFENAELSKLGKAKITDIIVISDNDYYYLKVEGSEHTLQFHFSEIEKVEENTFKIGDKVRWNGDTQYSNNLYMNMGMLDFLHDKKPHVISKITSDGSLQFKDDGVQYYFAPSWFEKVEEKRMRLEVTTDYKDPKWCMVRDNEDEEWKKRILINDNSDLNSKLAYGVIDDDDEEEDFLKNGAIDYPIFYAYAKPIPEKKYKPYDEPNFEWVKEGKKVIHRGKEHRISSVGVRNNGIWFVGLIYKDAYTTYLNMEQFLEECTWLNGSVCGEVKGEKDV